MQYNEHKLHALQLLFCMFGCSFIAQTNSSIQAQNISFACHVSRLADAAMRAAAHVLRDVIGARESLAALCVRNGRDASRQSVTTNAAVETKVSHMLHEQR